MEKGKKKWGEGGAKDEGGDGGQEGEENEGGAEDEGDEGGEGRLSSCDPPPTFFEGVAVAVITDVGMAGAAFTGAGASFTGEGAAFTGAGAAFTGVASESVVSLGDGGSGLIVWSWQFSR